ncbi:family 31 glycosyl hydrolase [Xylariomycetidae sp. FL0641]|nr:family 31 glycosyl hydrolase [Xylariomycetidae sp. FL0641]
MARGLLSLVPLLGLFSPISGQEHTSVKGLTRNIQAPNAVDPQTVCPGYHASSVKDTAHGLTADLTLAGKACNVYGTDIQDLTLTVEYQASDRLHVQIVPKYIDQGNSSWFLLPEEIVRKPTGDAASGKAGDLTFTWSNEPSFSFTVTRNSTGDVLFSTESHKLVYENQFIEFGSALPKDYNLYGLGEVVHSLRLGNSLTRTLYSADIGDIGANSYGVHPVYLDTRYFKVEKDGNLTYAPSPSATDKSATYKSFTHGLFQRNAHPQEVLLQESGLTWRALGGAIDLYFYDGLTPEDVTKTYQNSTTGLPAMQQYWTFGYHQSRWGYNNWSDIQNVLDNFAKNEIPLETMWNDIDYMHAYRGFENDPNRYSYDEGAKILEKIHGNDQHYVPIVDSGIYAPDPQNASDTYATFDRGVKEDAFLLNPDGSPYIGTIWPGAAVWPDWIGAMFSGTGAFQWWTSEISTYHDKIPFDGLWIDGSEILSYCEGSCGTANHSYNFDKAALPNVDHSRDINHPPYAIDNFQGNLGDLTASPNATNHDGTLQYDFHNLWGHQMLNATYHALLDVDPAKRPFIIGRSQFAGSGTVAGHWGGDNYAQWPYMYYSIPQALSFSLFGIPMFGADTCGFEGNATEELCSRWMQLSAFFPFYRNHNEFNATDQEPYVWPKVAEATKTAMKIRYALLPYIYTTFYQSHSTGSTTMRALSWEFPNEPWLADADRQFLLGSSLMVTPCLTEGATTVDGVFPGTGEGTVWYDWYNHTAITGVERGQNVTIDAPLGHIPLYLRGGKVVPMQEPGMTTKAVRASPWSLLVALDGDGKAEGGLYLDDGESVAPTATTWVDFSASQSSLSAKSSGTYVDANPLGNVTVLGIQNGVSNVQFAGKTVDAGAWHYDKASQVLSVQKLDGLTAKGAWSSEWALSWS